VTTDFAGFAGAVGSNLCTGVRASLLNRPADRLSSSSCRIGACTGTQRTAGATRRLFEPPTESPDVDRAEKKAAIESLNGVFKASNVVVVAHYSGLTVAQMQQLRRQMRQAGASVKVAKTASPRSLSKAPTSRPSVPCSRGRRSSLIRAM
jgi:hypothetical protein